MGTGDTRRSDSFITRSSDPNCESWSQLIVSRGIARDSSRHRSCHSGCWPRYCIIVEMVMVDVSCAAMSRKIVWLMTSSSLNRSPSASTRHSTENSSPSPARLAGR